MSADQGLPARKGGAKALLLTVLGEFVLPAGGQAWTSTLLAAAASLGVGEKNARQALARISDQGFVQGTRHGRSVRWSLTEEGRELLESGTERIYHFGTEETAWDGQWLVAHCPVAESQRSIRKELRTELGFLGFGELSASLLISPRVANDEALRRVLKRLGLVDESTILWSRSVNDLEDRQLVERAWDLAALADSYEQFGTAHASTAVDSLEPHQAFGALVGLVHDWRRFPFVDPDLPTQLLPADWPGADAAARFHDRHAVLSPSAQAWFLQHEADVLVP